MADNVVANGIAVATRSVTYSGDAAQNLQIVGLAAVSGSDDAKTAVDLPGDATNGLDVDVTRTPKSGTATLSNVAASTSSGTLLASNGSRKKVIIINDSETGSLFVKYGATASSSSFTRKLLPGETFEDDMYTGIIDGIWDVASGNARVTELT